MKILLIGHRGVGKSSLVQRLQIYSSMQSDILPVFDLDREIEKAAGASIKDIFELVGEESFRKLELSTYQQILKRSSYVLSLGAGFRIDQIKLDHDVQVVWVRRASDQLGRIFFDRPRLDKTVSALTEFQQRLDERNHRYSNCSHWIYDMPEGLSSPVDFEKNIFYNELQMQRSLLTLQKEHFEKSSYFQQRQLRWGFDFYEIRDDLLTEGQIKLATSMIQKNRTLLTFRNKNHFELFSDLIGQGYQFDWPLELGACPINNSTPFILSVHDRVKGEDISQTINRLNLSGQQVIHTAAKGKDNNIHLKLAVEIRTYEELEQGIHWQMEDPEGRSFLPRTTSDCSASRWKWCRLWLQGRQKINFLNDGYSKQIDQPTLAEWLATVSQTKCFAAVLGDPVEYSFSPIEHVHFFKEHKLPFYRIPISETEWVSAINVLIKMGIRCAAVTSPLKKKAYEISKKRSVICEELKSANTLYFKSDVIESHNTDIDGMKELLSGVDLNKEVFIWGGGGTLAALRKLIPNGRYFSSQTGEERTESFKEILHDQRITDTKNTQSELNMQVDTVIWAASPQAKQPPLAWKPEVVIDLNYREDSLAKEYCQKVGARYISGLYMFKVQAEKQRSFWGYRLGKE